MNEIILHPSRDFINARNPSSPFQFMLSSANSTWQFIKENMYAHPTDSWVAIKINGKTYFAFSKKSLFNLIKHNWGI